VLAKLEGFSISIFGKTRVSSATAADLPFLTAATAKVFSLQSTSMGGEFWRSGAEVEHLANGAKRPTFTNS
jgi:hypothetical protein